MREFGSFAAFAEFLLAASVAQTWTLERGLKKSVAIIEKDAKDQLGAYQDAHGQFEAWPELADSTKDDRLRQGFPENEPLLRTGELRDSISSNVDGLNAVVGSTSNIALYQELGTVSSDAEGRTSGQHIPPRPFLGPAGFKNAERVVHEIGAAFVEPLLPGVSLLPSPDRND